MFRTKKKDNQDDIINANANANANTSGSNQIPVNVGGIVNICIGGVPNANNSSPSNNNAVNTGISNTNTNTRPFQDDIDAKNLRAYIANENATVTSSTASPNGNAGNINTMSSSFTAFSNVVNANADHFTSEASSNNTNTTDASTSLRKKGITKINISKSKLLRNNTSHPNNNNNNNSNNSNNNNNNNNNNNAIKEHKKKKYHIRDPSDPNAAGDLVAMITPIRQPVMMMDNAGKNTTTTTTNTNNNNNYNPNDHLTNECLVALRVKSFEFSGNNVLSSTTTTSAENHHHHHHATTTTGDLTYGHIRKNMNHMNPKSKNKFRYICITRSTNKTLMKKRRKKNHVFVDHRHGGHNNHGHYEMMMDDDNNNNNDDDDSEDESSSSDEDDGDDDSNDGYDTLYNPDDGNDDTSPIKKQQPQKQQQQQKQKHSSTVAKSSTTNDHTHTNTHTKDQNHNQNRNRNRKQQQEKKEVTSFPNLVCLAIQSDGTHPDIRKILPLDQLVAIENVNGNGGGNGGGGAGAGGGGANNNNNKQQSVQLIFQNGAVVEIDFDFKTHGGGANANTGGETNAGTGTSTIVGTTTGGGGGGGAATGALGIMTLKKERFLWSLLQIHAILCTAVMERMMSHRGGDATTNIRPGTAGYRNMGVNVGVGVGVNGSSSSSSSAAALPSLTMRNVDRADLQYISTVNGFLSDSPVLCALLERQRNAVLVEKHRTKADATGSGGGTGGGGGSAASGGGTGASSGSDAVVGSRTKNRDGKEKKNTAEEMDGIAYDMIMGNFSQMTLFLTEEEKQDAEEVLNSAIWFDSPNGDKLEGGTTGTSSNTNNNNGGGVGGGGGVGAGVGDGNKLSMDEISTAEKLTDMLQKRMRDLEAETCRRLIAWEDEKYYNSTGTQPMPNRRDTMEALSLSVLFKTLDDLDESLAGMEEWLSDKAAAIKPLTDDCREVEEENRQLGFQRNSYGLISKELKRLLSGLDVPQDVEKILKDPTYKLAYHQNGNIDVIKSQDGVEDIYLAGRALKDAFDIVQKEGGVHLRGVKDRVERLLSLSNSFCDKVARTIVQVMEFTVTEVASDDYDYAASNNGAIGKFIRNTQRKFQSSLLAYVQLNEVLALLKPSKLPAIREEYSQIVSEGVLTKKRMKAYFASLPGKSSVNMTSYTSDLKEYSVIALRSNIPIEPGTAHMKPVEAKDIDTALSELLPVIAREAYFTAALFGLSAKHLSGREKKRNFESAKKSVDYSTQYFKYYISRICGIASEADAEGKKVEADPMLSLVASIHLNEAMDGYIDRQKKGGDHSLSLAYVRATILDLRKKVDKQWVAWVEEQIKWIHTNHGVPLNGKRAGIFLSFARFPSYLDHVMICIKAGRPTDQIPNLSKIKVVAYYIQKMAAALFKSLHECSERETTDQQYAANVMRMENSYFFTQTIKQRGSELAELFQKQITAASSICKQSTDSYLGFMIKKEFKPLHTLFANISRIRREVGDADVPIHVPRSTFEKTLTKECSREILKEKIGLIYYRLEKHLSETGGLLPVAWKALVKVLYEWFGRWEKLSAQCYKFTLEPSASDVVRIAKQAAGVSAKKINDERRKSGYSAGNKKLDEKRKSAYFK